MKKIPFAAIYSSSSERAKETVKYVMHQREVPTFYEDELKEIFLGDWQGRTIEEIRQNDFFNYDIYSHYPGQFIASHTESFGEVTERGIYILKKIAATYPNEKVLVVSHGVTITCIINAILKRGISQLWSTPAIKGTSVTIIEFVDSKWTVEDIGLTEHLQ